MYLATNNAQRITQAKQPAVQLVQLRLQTGLLVLKETDLALYLCAKSDMRNII